MADESNLFIILFMQDSVPPVLDLQSPLVKLIGTARRQIRQAFWARYAPHGLAPQQGWMLRILSAQGPLSLHELAQRVFMDDPTACRIVKSMNDKGLIESAPDPCHGRRLVLSVTDQGASLAPALYAIAEALDLELQAGLSEAETLALRSGLLKVIANLTPSAKA